MNALAAVALSGAAQGLVLALAIATLPYGQRRANQVLAALLLCLATFLFVIRFSYIPRVPPFWVYALLAVAYLFGPLLYLYSRLLSRPDYRLGWHAAWHGFPLLIILVLQLTGMLVSQQDLALRPYAELELPLKQRISLIMLPTYISQLAYSLLVYRGLLVHRREIRDSFSSLEGVSLAWLRQLSFVFACFALLGLVSEFGQWYTGRYVLPLDSLAVVLLSLMVVFIGVMGLRQPAIFGGGRVVKPLAHNVQQEGLPEPQETAVAEATAEHIGAKYSKTGLDETQVQRLWLRLEEHMVQARPWLDPGLKVAGLASSLGTRSNYLSQVINSCGGCNFYDYVNRYRVQESQRLMGLAEYRDKSLLELAFASGFASRNAFNTHFRKIAGKTPSQYRK